MTDQDKVVSPWTLDDVHFLQQVWGGACLPYTLPDPTIAAPDVMFLLGTLGLPLELAISASPKLSIHSAQRVILELMSPEVIGTKLKIGTIGFLPETLNDLFVDLTSGRVEKAFRRSPMEFTPIANSILDFHFQMLLFREYVPHRPATTDRAGLLLQVLAAFLTTIDAPHDPFFNRLFMSLADDFILELDWNEPARLMTDDLLCTFKVSPQDIRRVRPHHLPLLSLYGDFSTDAWQAVRDVQARLWPDEDELESNLRDLVTECLRCDRQPPSHHDGQRSLLNQLVRYRVQQMAREYGFPYLVASLDQA
ncbi:hypothetical protein [Deinococcus sp. QL22]|uniref:hypothetical protein n=1 Tax=Deinococcus sp. QL22 TaxID=2939437 RepID=UPI002017937F|nr:hypothetical protein [Deinococcus sp. QL22]UQN10592.1 hypothetical protein M1R55_30815 [Deinococcus sp. QL22]